MTSDGLLGLAEDACSDAFLRAEKLWVADK